MEIIIPFKTPSVNHLYNHKGSRRFLTKEAKDLRFKIKDLVKNVNSDDYKEQTLKVTLNIHEDWLTKAGEMSRKDVVNKEKFITDSVFEGLGIDDKMIIEYKISKIQDIIEQSVMIIEIVGGLNGTN